MSESTVIELPTQELKLTPSKMQVDITKNYTPRLWWDIASPAMFPRDADAIYLNDRMYTRVVGFNVDRDKHGFSYFGSEPVGEMVPTGDALIPYSTGSHYDRVRIQPGSLERVDVESRIPLITDPQRLKDVRCIGLGCSPIEDSPSHLLVYLLPEKYVGRQIILVDTSAGGHRETELTAGSMDPVDFAINTTKYADAKGRWRNMYAVAFQPLVKGEGQIRIYHEDGSLKETIDQPAKRIIRGSAGIFYFVTDDYRVGMINTVGFSADSNQSGVIIVLNKESGLTNVRSITAGPGNTLIIASKEGQIVVVDGLDGHLITKQQVVLEKNQELAEIAMTPDGNELFYTIWTKVDGGKQHLYVLQSFKMS